MIQVAIEKYKKVQELNWNETEKLSGKRIKIKGFPRDKKVKIYSVLLADTPLPKYFHLFAEWKPFNFNCFS